MEWIEEQVVDKPGAGVLKLLRRGKSYIATLDTHPSADGKVSHYQSDLCDSAHEAKMQLRLILSQRLGNLISKSQEKT